MPDTASRSLFWTIVESGGLSILALIMLLVVARTIGPMDFGVVALVLGIVQILFILVDTLLHDAIVQRRYLNSRHLDTAFWTCSSAGIVLAVGCWLGAGIVADLFGSPSIESLLPIAALSLVFGGLGSVPLAVLHRERKFKAIALRSLCARFLGALAALALLVAGYGLWSLIGQHVVQVALNSVLAWPALTWRPRRRFSAVHLRRLLSIGMFALGSRIIWIASARFFIMFVGYFIGIAAAGTLNIAQRVVDTLYDLLSGAAYNLSLSYFAKKQQDRSALVQLYKTTVNFGALTTFPLFIGLMACAPGLIETLLGEQWIEAVPLVRVLAVAAAFNFIIVFAEVAVMAMGRPKQIFLFAASTFVFIIVLFLALRPDTTLEAGILWGCRALLTGPLFVVAAHRMLGISGWEIAKVIAPPALAVAIMVGVLMAASQELTAAASPVLQLGLTVGLGAVVYIAAICLLDAPSVRRLADFILAGAVRKGLR